MFCPAPILAFLDVGGPEMLLIFVLVLVLFGGKRMPELAKNLGKSLRDFKKTREGVEDQIKRALDEDPVPAKRTKRLRKPKPEGATTTPEDTTVYDEAAEAAGAAAATTAPAATDATDVTTEPSAPASSSDDPAGHASDVEPDNDYEIDPYADEYIGGTMESDAAAHGLEDDTPDENSETTPATDEAGSGEGEPDKKKTDPDPGMNDGGGI